jgi:AMP-binding enzyme
MGRPQPTERARKLGRAGAPAIGVSVKISPEGEIMARANHIMSSYWRNAEATADAIRDGWFHTGDGGVVDDEGYFAITDRKKDVIISGGENVSSIEVEDTLFAHPAVQEVAVIGVPHEKWGETVKALVVLVAGSNTTERELIDFCKSKLAGYKCPTLVEFRTELARTATGKLQKFKLREQTSTVELLLEPRAPAVGVAQAGDERVDHGYLVGPSGKLAHLGEAPGGQPVVVGVGVHEFVLDESPVDRQYGERFHRFVCVREFGPDPVVVETEGECLVPGKAGILERADREQHGFIWARGQCGKHVVVVVMPRGTGCSVQTRRGRCRWPPPEHFFSRRQQLGWKMSCQEVAPILGRLQRLVPGTVVGCLMGPVDGEVDLADLLERLRGVLEPRPLPSRCGSSSAEGPYADNLRHVLKAVEGHHLRGFGDGSMKVQEAEVIEILPGAAAEADAALSRNPVVVERMDRVLRLVDGFESPYGLELLASVHWAAVHDDRGPSDELDVAVQRVQEWSGRKQRMFTEDHIATAFERLREQGWLARLPAYA